MAEIKWDIKRGANIYRAIYASRLQSWISKGVIKRGEVTVWQSGFSGWRKPEELEELMPFFERWEKQQLTKRREPEKLTFMQQKKKIKNILIVDDEKDMCLLLSDALRQRKYNVMTANTKRETLSYLKAKIPDLVFLDLRLPDGDGMKILSKIKNENPDTVVNIITAFGSEESRQEAKKRGAHTFIDKPFDETEILKCIRQFQKKIRN